MTEHDDRVAITVSRGQLSEFAGRKLSDDEIRRIADAWPNSSIPEAFATIAESIVAPFTNMLPEDYWEAGLHESDSLLVTPTDTLVHIRTPEHAARPDDLPEPGDRCKDCGKPITWMGPSQYDWLHVDDPRA